MVLPSFSSSKTTHEDISHASDTKKIKLPGVENLLQIHPSCQRAVFTPAGQAYDSSIPSYQQLNNPSTANNQLRYLKANLQTKNRDNYGGCLTEHSCSSSSLPVSLESKSTNPIYAAPYINENTLNIDNTLKISSMHQTSQAYPSAKTPYSIINNNEVPINSNSHRYPSNPRNGNGDHYNHYYLQRQNSNPTEFGAAFAHRPILNQGHPNPVQKTISNSVGYSHQEYYDRPPSYTSQGNGFNFNHSLTNTNMQYQTIQPPLPKNPYHNLHVHAPHMADQNLVNFQSQQNVRHEMKLPQRPDVMMSFPHAHSMIPSYPQAHLMQPQEYQYAESPNNNFQKEHVILLMSSKQTVAWLPKDDKLLCHLKEEKKLGWRDVATYFPTRTPNACQFRWRRIVSAAKAAESKRASPYMARKLTKSLPKAAK